MPRGSLPAESSRLTVRGEADSSRATSSMETRRHSTEEGSGFMFARRKRPQVRSRGNVCGLLLPPASISGSTQNSTANFRFCDLSTGSGGPKKMAAGASPATKLHYTADSQTLSMLDRAGLGWESEAKATRRPAPGRWPVAGKVGGLCNITYCIA